MTTRIGVESNIESVMASVDDVKDDIRDEMRKRVGAAMRVLWADTRQYVLNDPNNSGDLFASIQRDTTDHGGEIEFSVYTDPSIAPHAAIVEYGTGRYDEWSGSEHVGPPTPEQIPPNYPFDTPDDDDLLTVAYYIEEWMVSKGIDPETGNLRSSAIAIARKLVNEGQYAHPFLRPAWFDNELQIKRAARNALKNAVR